MSKSEEPRWIDDGLIVHKNITVYVCNADDIRVNGYDVHLNVGEDDRLDHIMFENTATLYDRSTLAESWGDAAGWLRETAGGMQELAAWIDAHMRELGIEVDE